MPPKEAHKEKQGDEDDDADDWEDDGDWQDEHGQEGGISGRKGVDDLPEGWSCSVKAGLPGRFVVQYVSKEGISIKSKRQLRSYLEERGVGDSAIEQISARADFSQKYARRFVLLNTSTDDGDVADADTSRDSLIALAMQSQYDRELGLSDDDDDDPDYGSSGESVGSQGSVTDGAVGGWRRRQSELEQETAEDYDVSCLEIKTLTCQLEGSCPVCQCDWESGDEVRVLPCDHQFHVKCIDEWLKKHKANCPLCKKDVREDWEDEDEELWDPIEAAWKSPSARDGDS